MNVAICGSSPFYSQVSYKIKRDQCPQAESLQACAKKVLSPITGSHPVIDIADGDTAKNISISSGLLNIHDGAVVYDVHIFGNGTVRVYGNSNEVPLAYDDKNPTTDCGKIISNHHGEANNITINEEGMLIVAYGGKVNGALLKNGKVSIQKGGNLNGLVVTNGTVEMRSTPYQSVGNRMAVATDTKIHSGLFTLKDNSRAYNNRIDGGEFRVMKNNNSIESSVVGAGGKLTLQGGQSEWARIEGGLFEVLEGANAKNTFISNYGKAIVADRWSIADLNYVNAGKMEVRDGGSAKYNIIGGDSYHVGELDVSYGGSVKDTTVYANGRLAVSNGAFASLTKVKQGGYMSVRGEDSLIKNILSYHPRSNETDIFSGGLVDVDNNGRVQNTVVHNGGVLRIRNTYSEGCAYDTTIEQGGCLVIEKGARAIDTTIAGITYPSITGESPKNSYECIG